MAAEAIRPQTHNVKITTAAPEAPGVLVTER
jgi:hypothetical protein